MEERDRILHRVGLDTWLEYLASQPDGAVSGMFALVIDEFVSLCNAPTVSASVRKEMFGFAATLTSEAAKFGAGLLIAATDPTQAALREGYIAVKQMGRITFGFQTPGPSQALLQDNSAVGLPPGHFIIQLPVNDGSDLGAVSGIGFHPTKRQLEEYVARPPKVIVPAPPAMYSIAPRELGGVASKPVIHLKAGDPDPIYNPGVSGSYNVRADAEIISRYSQSSLNSRTAIARQLGEDGVTGWGSSGDNVKRVEAALSFLATNGDQWAAKILQKAGVSQ